MAVEASSIRKWGRRVRQGRRRSGQRVIAATQAACGRLPSSSGGRLRARTMAGEEANSTLALPCTASHEATQALLARYIATNKVELSAARDTARAARRAEARAAHDTIIGEVWDNLADTGMEMREAAAAVGTDMLHSLTEAFTFPFAVYQAE